MKKLPVICIAGPTGAGKSALALELAEALAAECPVCVINADSRQVYKDFPIITAQPGPDELARCPHRLYGFLAIEEKITAGAYARLAEAELAHCAEQGRLPILVGGTGLYLKSLLGGIAPIPQIAPEVCRYWQDRCDAEASPALHRLLTEQDPAYAAKIHPNDRQRITRALEVLSGTGHTLSWWHAQQAEGAKLAQNAHNGHAVIKIGVGLPLNELETLLSTRIDKMLRAGAIAEAEAARALCPRPEAPGWSGIGCAELYQYLEGRANFAECRELWFRNTRAYAKRQLTWFKGQEKLEWVQPPLASLPGQGNFKDKYPELFHRVASAAR